MKFSFAKITACFIAWLSWVTQAFQIPAIVRKQFQYGASTQLYRSLSGIISASSTSLSSLSSLSITSSTVRKHDTKMVMSDIFCWFDRKPCLIRIFCMPFHRLVLIVLIFVNHLRCRSYKAGYHPGWEEEVLSLLALNHLALSHHFRLKMSWAKTSSSKQKRSSCNSAYHIAPFTRMQTHTTCGECTWQDTWIMTQK